MAISMLLYKKVFGDVTMAILGDCDNEDDFLNIDGDYPTTATMRIFSRDDDNLAAVISNFNNTKVFEFDNEDWFDCLIHSIIWHNIDPLGNIYREERTATIGTGSEGESGPWFPFGCSYISGQAMYNSSEMIPTLDGTYSHFKILDCEYTRAYAERCIFNTRIRLVLALSSTGEGDPEKILYFNGDVNVTDPCNIGYRKVIHYYDLGGSSGEETIDHKYATEWSTADVGDLVTPYDPDNYELNAVCEVDEIGVDPEDSDLHYISYKGIEGSMATDIAHFEAIVAGTEDATTSDKKILNATSGNVSDGQTLINSAWTKYADNVYTATGRTNGNGFNYLMIYNPKYDIYQIWGAQDSYNGDCTGDFAGYPAKMAAAGATIVDTSDPNCDVYTCTYGGKMYVDIVPKSSLVSALQAVNKGVDFFNYKPEGSYAMVKNPSKQRDITEMISPVSNDPPIPAGIYCYNIIDDYNAYLSDYDPSAVDALVPTMEYEYCSYYEGITTSSTSLKIYDGTTELDDATAVAGTVTGISSVEGTDMTKIEFTDSEDQSYVVYYVKCENNKDGYIKKSVIIVIPPAMANGLHETDLNGIPFDKAYFYAGRVTVQNVVSGTLEFTITTKGSMETLAFSNNWQPVEIGGRLYPFTNLDPDMPPDLYLKRSTADETFALNDWLSPGGAKQGRHVIYMDQATGLIAALNYIPASASMPRYTIQNFINNYKADRTSLGGFSVYASKDDIETAKTSAAHAQMIANSVRTREPSSATYIGFKTEMVQCAVGRDNMFNIWQVTALFYDGVECSWRDNNKVYFVELCPLYTDLPVTPVGGTTRSTDDYLCWNNAFRNGIDPLVVATAQYTNKESLYDLLQSTGMNNALNYMATYKYFATLEEAEALTNTAYYHATT